MSLPNFLSPAGGFSVGDRRITFLLGIIAFVAGYAGAQMAHTLPFTRLSLDLTEGQMSFMLAFVRAVSLLGVAFSMFADRRGRRTPLLAAFALLAAASLATAFVPTTIVFALSQSLVRIAVVAIAALGIVLLAEGLSPPVRAYGIGLYGLAGSLGVGTGLLLLPIAERAPEAWRILFAFAGIGLLALPMLIRFLPESRAFRPGPTIPFYRALRMGLGKHFWPLAGISFFVSAFAAPAFDFVLERLINDLGWEASAARFLLIVFSGIGVIGLLIGGRMADLPVTIHFITQAPELDGVARIAAIRQPLGSLSSPPGAKIDREHRLPRHSLTKAEKLVGTYQIGFKRVPRLVKHPKK